MKLQIWQINGILLTANMKQKFYFDKKYFKTHTSHFVFGHLGSREKIKYEELKTFVSSSFLPHTVLDLLHRYHLFI